MRILLSIILCFILQAQAAETSDVWIVEHPQALTVLDAYQRSVPETVKKDWPSFVPIFLGERETLPDGITSVQSAVFLNRRYFLILNAQGQPAGIENSGYHRLLKKVTVLKDTVQIKSGQPLPLLQPKTLQAIRNGQAGEKFVRLFRHGRYYYLRTLHKPYLFAFLAVRYRYRLQKVDQRQLQSERNLQDFVQQVNYFLNRKNRVYQKLFDYFRQTTGKFKNQPAPQWRLIRQGNRLRIVFSEPQWLAKWQDSTRLFKTELNRLCRQFGFTMREAQAGTFTIQRKRP